MSKDPLDGNGEGGSKHAFGNAVGSDSNVTYFCPHRSHGVAQVVIHSQAAFQGTGVSMSMMRI
jgi:hypothetical protein